ncbi:hypothetical protein GYA27_03785 [candidate division WWE3 bacterium]|uniref:Uncharacterized protein n=1 Tax=candidate division WWE3 bacterium TaxID=2053526 RepID=A0A7X9HGV4_UNCKA|nr:hypothetical protein [candidate division WWE3 bacterium]
MLKRMSSPFIGFLQASGLVSYIIVVSLVLTNVTRLFRNDTGEFYAPIIMLLVFIFSAVISASLVLGRAGVLFWDKKYKEAFKLIGWTLTWIAFYLLLFVIFLSI